MLHFKGLMAHNSQITARVPKKMGELSWQATKISMDLNREAVRNLTQARAAVWGGKHNTYLEALRVVANIMSHYEDVLAVERP
jgi:hypothetical protein